MTLKFITSFIMNLSFVFNETNVSSSLNLFSSRTIFSLVKFSNHRRSRQTRSFVIIRFVSSFSSFSSCFSNFFDFSISSFSSTSRTTKRRCIRDLKYEKVLKIVKTLKNVKWFVNKFLKTLFKHRSALNLKKIHDTFLKYVYVNFSIQDNFIKLLRRSRMSKLFDTLRWTWLKDVLRAKIKTLINHSTFEHFVSSFDEFEFEFVEYMKKVNSIIQSLISRWLDLLRDACKETKSQKSYTIEQEKKNDVQHVRRSIIILKTLCHVMRFNRSTNFQIIFDLYLYQDDARRRIIDTFS